MIETARLCLRPVRDDDLDWLQPLFSNADVMRYSMGRKTRAEVQQWIAYATLPGNAVFAVIHTTTGAPIGYCSLMNGDTIQAGALNLGYRLLPPYWGHGYAREAVRALLTFAQRELQARTIIATIDPGNKASIRVAEAVGMVQVGEIMLAGYDYPDLLYELRL